MASSPVTPTKIERPPSIPRRSTSPTLASSDDVESQRSFRYNQPKGIRRGSTFSTLSSPIAEEKPLPKRTDTQDSTSPSELSPQLKREATLLPEEEALHGYPKLASFIGGQQGYWIFKRFASLNTRNLLYHQAKLIHLEHELNELEHKHAHQKDLHYKVHLFDAETGTPRHTLRMKYEEVSRALEKYNSLILDQKRMHALPEPDDSFVGSIYNFIHNERSENPQWLEHPENMVYAVWEDRKPVQRDLITLDRELRTQDPFTKVSIVQRSASYVFLNLDSSSPVRF